MPSLMSLRLRVLIMSRKFVSLLTLVVCAGFLVPGDAFAQEQKSSQEQKTQSKTQQTDQERTERRRKRRAAKRRAAAEKAKQDAKKKEKAKEDAEKSGTSEKASGKQSKDAGKNQKGSGKQDQKSDAKKSGKKSDAAGKDKDKKNTEKKKSGGKKSAAGDKKVDADKELTLENLFPEKSMFGPRASRMAFSTDGRFGAYLYRPRVERRHGSDLWLYDFQTKKKVRLTNVVMMSEFQKSARKVRDERLKAAKKKSSDKTDKDEGDAKKKTGKGKDAKGKSKNEKKLTDEEMLKLVMTVSDKDADDEKGARYSGISSFSWHPKKNALLLSSEGDVYQIANVADPDLVRLTRTRRRESRVDYLPDGSGYTFIDDDVVYRVLFGKHMVEQVNPSLPSGQNLSSYSVSPDGTKLVLVARSGSGRPSGARTVDYIRYRDRFAKAASVPRTVSDDKTEPRDVVVYLFDLSDARTEESELIRVFKTQIDEPRDIISSPEWAPDSSKVTFCFFDQKNSEVQILLGEFPGEEESADGGDAKSESAESASAAAKSEQDDGPKEHPAKVVYRFRHFGGPNTPRMVSPDFAWDSQHIVFVSEQTGFRHVHLLDPLYESVRQLTSGHFEVYPLRLSKDHKHLFVTATKDSSAREMVYNVALESGEMTRISKPDGTYSSVAVSNDGKRLLANYVTYGKLSELIRQDGGNVETLTDSHTETAKHFTRAKPEFFEYKNRHGHTIKGLMLKPDGWKKSHKRPLLIYVYGGPLGTRKSVVDGSYSSSGYLFNNYMAKKHNYVTVVIDPRGQSGYGGVFEKANYERVGKPQVEDLVDGVKYLTEEYNIDKKRVGVYGWSFGGFQTQMCLYTAPDVFQVGIAGAGPTEWENYNSWYATGTIGPSGTDKPDQKKYSLRPLAKNLKGKLLLIHGIEDTNVLFQDTVAIYRELLQAGKETNVELFLDPTGGHGLGGDVKRLNRYRKYEEFLLRTLGEGA